ncbi:MAG: hypothetical protein KGY74_07870 [Candidatus Cloacimonetes bacterium]|nr:hypothetical protein [Candidatus Cloacimonadota bacterium]
MALKRVSIRISGYLLKELKKINKKLEYGITKLARQYVIVGLGLETVDQLDEIMLEDAWLFLFTEIRSEESGYDKRIQLRFDNHTYDILEEVAERLDSIVKQHVSISSIIRGVLLKQLDKEIDVGMEIERRMIEGEDVFRIKRSKESFLKEDKENARWRHTFKGDQPIMDLLRGEE